MIKEKSKPDLAIPSELELIIRIIILKEKPFTEKGKDLLKNTNWEKFIGLCTQHGVISIVYKKIREFDIEIIPEKIIKKLKELYQQIVQWNFIQSNQLIKVLKLLRKNNINVIPIKGPVISLQAYGDIGYRMFQDLDLLISYKDFIPIYDLLYSEGYQPSSVLSDKKKKLWKRFRRDIEFRIDRTLIDLHQRITQAHSAFDLKKGQIKKAGFVRIMGKNIPVLSPEDTLIYLIINSTKDQWNMLRMIVDLFYLIKSNPEMNWNYILKRSKKMGIQRMVLTGLHLMSAIIRKILPDIINSEINKSKDIKELSENYKIILLFKGSGNKTPDRVKSISATFDSNFHKFRYLLYFFFTPTPEDFKWISLPESFYFLYRIIRPIRLLFLAFRSKK